MSAISGKEVYKNECVICHGEAGNAGDAESANLQNSLLSLEQIMAIVRSGTADMPPFDYLNDEQIEAVSVYAEKFQEY